MCDRLHPDYYTADVASDILSNGNSSRLHQRLVKEAKAFVEIDAYITSSNDIGLFTFEGQVADGVDVQHATDLIWQELEKMKAEKVATNELQKCKNKMLTYLNFSEASLLNRAISLAYYELLGDANLINAEEKNYDSVTTSIINSLHKKHLQKKEAIRCFI